jgi:hypothetical protein
VPRNERQEKHAIARDAQRLRRSALSRMCELERLRCARVTRTVAQETV